MGFKIAQNRTFIKYKEGKFYKTSDKELTEPLGDFEGRLLDINIKSETFNGKPMEKLNLELDGGDGIYQLSIPFESSMASKLIGFLKSVDLTQILTLSPAFKKEGEKEIRTIFVKEGTGDGPYAKQYYTKDGLHQAPKMKKLKSGKYEKEDFTEFYREVVKNELRPALSGKAERVTVPIVDTDEEEVDSGSLPF